VARHDRAAQPPLPPGAARLPADPLSGSRPTADPQVHGTRRPDAAAERSPRLPVGGLLSPDQIAGAAAEADPAHSADPVRPAHSADPARSAGRAHPEYTADLPAPAAERPQGQLMPAAPVAVHRPGGRAESPARTPSPVLSIGTIEVTLLPPPPDPPPARTAPREPRQPPPRLSRGLGRRFGQGQR
jgi:hypothetical protein